MPRVVTTLRRGARAKSYTGTVVNSTGADKCDQRNQIKSLETDPGILRTLKCDRHRGSSVRSGGKTLTIIGKTLTIIGKTHFL